MAAVQQNISYKRELLAGDIVEVTSRLLEIRDKSIRFLHEMRNAETREIAAGVMPEMRAACPIAHRRTRHPGRGISGITRAILACWEALCRIMRKD